MKTYKTIILGLLGMMSLNSCKDYLDINSDPATPQIADVKALTPPVFSAMTRGVQFDARYLGLVIQTWGYTSANYWAELHGWPGANSDVTGEIWRQNYYGLGENLNLIVEDGLTKQQYNYVGLAKAVQAWSWQTTTDYHGEIILDQAFDDTRFSFDYQEQKEVYDHVVNLANEAISYFQRTDGVGNEAGLGASDQVYNGSSEKWIKFCYGLLARNANNLSNKSSYDPDKVIEYVNKSLASNSDNFMVPFDGTIVDNANFFGPMRNNLSNYRQSNLINNLLNGTLLNAEQDTIIDPRRNSMITASLDSVFRGTNQGAGAPNGGIANPMSLPNPWGGIHTTNPGAGNGKYLFMDDAPYPLMTYSELQFIKAEAAFHKGDLTTAYQAYLNGVEASIDFVGELGESITSSQKTDYMSSKSVVQSSNNLTLKAIMLQKYIAVWGFNFVETWSDLRRYHYFLGDAKGNNPYEGAFIIQSLSDYNNGNPAYRYRPRWNSEYIYNLEALKKIGGDQEDFHTYETWFSKAD